MRARYDHAIEWLALNDDTTWLDDSEYGISSVATSLVADIFGKDEEVVIKDLRKAVKRLEKSR